MNHMGQHVELDIATDATNVPEPDFNKNGTDVRTYDASTECRQEVPYSCASVNISVVDDALARIFPGVTELHEYQSVETNDYPNAIGANATIKLEATHEDATQEIRKVVSRPMLLRCRKTVPAELGISQEVTNQTLDEGIWKSFAAFMYPQIGAILKYGNSGVNSTAWSGTAAANSAAIASQFTSGRAISGGIRCITNQGAGATTQGVLYAGTIAGCSSNTLTGFSPGTLSNLPQADLGISARGCCVLSRPVDNDAFVFAAETIGTSGTIVAHMTAPYIVGVGFPAGTIIYIECILNVEALTGMAAGGLSSDPNLPNEEPAASDFFPSPEALMSRIRPALQNAALMDFAQSAASAIHPVAGSAVGAMRSAFGQGRHQRFARATMGNGYIQGTRAESLTIEEMKSEL
jgi:hypothetical protein